MVSFRHSMTPSIITPRLPRRESARCRRGAMVALFLTMLPWAGATSSLHAQLPSRLDLGGAITTGGEAERYLRTLQLVQLVPLYPWTVLELTPREERRLAPRGSHPWQARFTSPDSVPRFAWLRPTERVILNSAFPFQSGGGPTWSGRGVTGELQGGFRAAWNRVSLQVAPVAFLSQNSAFPLAPNGRLGNAQFADARYPANIDFPQRFGDQRYGRVDAGTSTLAIDAPGFAVGLSNAPQRWGPAREYPLVLGPAAGGFPHAYIGTRAPVDLRAFTLHTRVIAGTLTKSAFSPMARTDNDRFAAAFVVSLMPRGLEGLEVGGTRFFETHASPGLAPLSRVFSGIIRRTPQANLNIPNENQIVSGFFRWAPPRAGFELYGELYREDYPGDLRRFIEKPDDLTSFTLGFQRVWTRSASHFRVLRAEVVNGELSAQERGQRGFDYPISPYTHFEVVEGHTQRGLILGSAEAFGGAAWHIGVDDFTERGRRTFALERTLHLDQLPNRPISFGDTHPDVLYAARFEAMRFAGTRDYGVTLVPALNLNRNLERGNDRFNLYASVSAHGW